MAEHICGSDGSSRHIPAAKVADVGAPMGMLGVPVRVDHTHTLTGYSFLWGVGSHSGCAACSLQALLRAHTSTYLRDGGGVVQTAQSIG